MLHVFHRVRSGIVTVRDCEVRRQLFHVHTPEDDAAKGSRERSDLLAGAFRTAESPEKDHSAVFERRENDMVFLRDGKGVLSG